MLEGSLELILTKVNFTGEKGWYHAQGHQDMYSRNRATVQVAKLFEQCSILDNYSVFSPYSTCRRCLIVWFQYLCDRTNVLFCDGLWHNHLLPPSRQCDGNIITLLLPRSLMRKKGKICIKNNQRKLWKTNGLTGVSMKYVMSEERGQGAKSVEKR